MIRMFSKFITIGCVAFGTELTAAERKPYIPESEKTVLERLPGRFQAGSSARVRLSETNSARMIDDKALAAEARACMELARQRNDPRLIGHAEAILARAKSSSDLQILLTKAAVYQRSHRFEAALQILEKINEEHPDNRQALLLQTTILQVLGRISEAKKASQRLSEIAPGRTDSIVSALWLESLTGSAEKAFVALQDHLRSEGRALSHQERLWIHGMLGDIATRLGRPEDAERHFKNALLLAPTDPFLLTAFSEFLINQGREAESFALIKKFGGEGDWALLQMACALADQNSSETELATLTAELKARFDGLRARNDKTHLREEALFALRVQKNAQLALTHALQNWKLQKEPVDALLVLESAEAANAPHEAGEVLVWVREIRLEDVRLERAIKALRLLL